MKLNRRLSASQFIALGYIIVILIGTLILITPLASANFNWTNPLKALFTATSATCVTGLIVLNTATYWSTFGQIVILLLIQIGGIGFMAVISIIAVALKKKINLKERLIIMQSSGSLGVAGVINLLKHIVIFTLSVELIGAVLLATQFIPDFGVVKGIYFAIFHSISAFCNAGFDLLGTSLISYQSNIIVNLTVMSLIAIGGLGFIVWSDLAQNHFRFKKLQLHTKMVLIVTNVLIFLGAGLFLLFEFNGEAFKNLSVGEKIMAAFFQSITCRTAGYNTVDLKALSDSSFMLSTILMFIGGSPGSTAGGIKTTTFAVLILSMVCAARKQPNIVVGKRQLEKNASRQASAIAIFYIGLIVTSTMIILALEQNNPAGWEFRDVLFETASAIGTVGLSSIGSATLSSFSQIILILLMYVGRLGALIVLFAINEKSQNEAEVLQRPTDKILIG